MNTKKHLQEPIGPTTFGTVGLVIVVLQFTVATLTVAAPSGPSLVAASGRQLMVQKRNPDGTLASPTPWIMTGVNWSPASTNTMTSTTDPNNANVRRPEFGKWYATDLPLMKSMNVNTVRIPLDLGVDATEGPVGLAVLDACYTNGIFVIMTVDNAINDTNRAALAVNYYKNHPAILAWALGNEVNINFYYGVASSIAETMQRTEIAAALIKTLDANHPVVCSYGEIDINDSGRRLADTAQYVNNTCPHVDLWALNIYRGKTFGSLFTQWASITTKPMCLGEFGVDAYHSTALVNPNPPGVVNEAEQADWDVTLWNHLFANLSAREATNVAIGGCVHEWNDSWWKIQPATSQETGGWIANVFPDGMSSEEIFGICNINRVPRLIYSALQTAFAPNYIPPPGNTIIVTNTNDAGAGSLRQAIGSASSGDTIKFATSVVGTIVLFSELVIDTDLIVRGPGASALTLSGNNASRVFNITNVVVSISGLTIANGSAPDYGGGIKNLGWLDLGDCVVSNNFAGTLGNGVGQGAGVYTAGPLTVNRCSFSSNTSTGNGGAIASWSSLVVGASTFTTNHANFYGGAIYNRSSCQIKTCVFSGNSAPTSGGAIWNENNSLIVDQSTLSANNSTYGGGIANKNGAVTINNCTISGNDAGFGGGGGGVFNGAAFETGGTLTISSSTVVSNRSNSGGGGVYVAVGMARFRNTIVARNSLPGGGSGPDCNGSILSDGYNLIGDGTGCVGFTNGLNGDQVGTGATPIDPRLGPLADHDGPAPTHALRFDSPALDQGNSFGLATDQRGLLRAIDDLATANASGGDASDIGAYEADPDLRFTAINISGTDIRLCFSSLLGRTYGLSRRDDLDGSWNLFSNNIPGTGGSIQILDAGAGSQPRRFYRAEKLP